VHVQREIAARIGHTGIRAYSDDQKGVLDLADAQLMSHRTALGAVYVLQPVAQADGPAVQRVRLSDVEAALAVVRHTKVGKLLGGDEAALVFDYIVSVVQSVPVYQLMVAWDLERIDDVVRQLMAWHTDTPSIDASALDD
jgi:hypothetical protein